MTTHRTLRDPFLTFWLRVREFAVPPSMIETATARRTAGDWAGACAAAGVDVDLAPRTLVAAYGRELTDRIRADLRHLAPDLLRWHLPRIAPRGLLRPGLTIPLARYETGDAGPREAVHLVVRTPPAWADAGQRISLALWDGTRAAPARHPHPRPSARFRLDLHRHLWDARRTAELGERSGAGPAGPARGPALDPAVAARVPAGRRCAVHRWAAEADLLLRAGSRTDRTFAVRLGGGHRLLLDLATGGDGPGAVPVLRIADPPGERAGDIPPVLPDAATWALPDAELVRAGALDPGRLHPLVRTALYPDHSAPAPAGAEDGAGRVRLVDCRGEAHRIGLVDGVLAPLDHDPAELRREELLAALTGTPLPCLQAVDAAHRRPDCLGGVRERLDHGDIGGALAVVEGLLGPDAVLRDGPLRDELESAARRRIAYGLFRAGLAEPAPRTRRGEPVRPRSPRRRSRR